MFLKRSTMGKLNVLQLLDSGELAIDQGGVGQRPEMFSGLELGRVGREEEQVDMLRDA